jgi:transposase
MAKFNSAALIRKRKFQRLTGVEAPLFLAMAERVRGRWQKQVVDTKDRAGRPWSIGGLEDHLLVLLILYRCAITQDFLGLLYGVDKAAISRALRRIEPIVAEVLGVKRAIRVTREEAEALIVDATEQPIQRPSRKQRCWYSGKKKRHTIKTEAIITAQGRIVSVSPSVPGRVSDITIRRRGRPLPKGARIYADSGYQGLQDEHPNIDIPYKKTKKRKLTKDERAYNHALSRFRVRVEHTFAKIKSFRMFSERFRYSRATYTAKFSAIAGIINLIAGF